MTNISKFHIVAIGVAAKDKIEDDNYIEVYPAEIQPVKPLELSEIDFQQETVIDDNGNIQKILNTKSTLIKAKWIPIGQPNRLGAPDVCKGEKVFLYRYAEQDEYYWSMYENDLRLRKNEKQTIILSNRPEITTDGTELDKAYYITFDTINKLFHLHTDDSDGELCTYDIEINTKDGILTVIDGNDNSIELSSEDGDLTINTNATVTINTPMATINCDISAVNATVSASVIAGAAVTVAAPLINIKGGITNIN